MAIERIKWTRKRLANKRWRYYYYAFDKGPLFWKSDKPIVPPYPRAFVGAYNEAMATCGPKYRGDFESLVESYLASPEFKALADTTRGDQQTYLAEAVERFGHASIAVLSDPRFRGEIMKWRDTRANRPRAADLSIVALSAAMKYAWNAGVLPTNPAAKIPKLYRRPDDKRPWSEADIALFMSDASQSLRDAIQLFIHTGPRRGDVVSMGWKHDKGTHIARETGKGERYDRMAYNPLTAEARAFLDALRDRQKAESKRREEDGQPATLPVTMLTNSYGKPWSASGLSSSFDKHRKRHGIKTSMHRLRNNYATRLMIAGIDDRTIADAMGWSTEDVQEMRRVYVDREQVVAAAVHMLEARKP